jgi:protein tyrosine/serine phosphatase
MIAHRFMIACRLLSVPALVSTIVVQAIAASARPAGVPNFYQVTDRLYRGGQPTDQGWPELAKLGIKTVVDLRRRVEHSTDAESLAVTAAGMSYVNYEIQGFRTPTSDQIGKALALLDGSGPVFIHCKLGKDRTGTVVAAYRIAKERWPNNEALAEARSCGLHWYEKGMQRFIASYKYEPAPVAAGGEAGPAAAVPATETAAAAPAR